MRRLRLTHGMRTPAGDNHHHALTTESNPAPAVDPTLRKQ